MEKKEEELKEEELKEEKLKEEELKEEELKEKSINKIEVQKQMLANKYNFDKEIAARKLSKESFDKIDYLQNIGWFMKFEVNTVMKGFTGYLYSKEKEENHRVEIAFVYDSIDECIDAAHSWKLQQKV